MIELELFYNLTVVSIREAQAEYLKGQKRQPFAQELPEVDEASAEAYAKMSFFQKFVYKLQLRKQKRRYKKALRAQKQPVDERLTKGYNAGIEMALHVLDREFKVFYKRMEKEEQ
ncbi:MAG: hypothetical protein IJ514_03085 [Clostridia bacterium]|nr:hypothetical protein [Clostridia bacterium]